MLRKKICMAIIPYMQYFLQNVPYVRDTAQQKHVNEKFMTQLHTIHVTSACS